MRAPLPQATPLPQVEGAMPSMPNREQVDAELAAA